MPPKNLFSLLTSACFMSSSRFVCALTSLFEKSSSSCISDSMRLDMVLKFVRVPPSHREFMYIAPTCVASLRISSLACGFVPTNRHWPPSATMFLMASLAFSTASSVFVTSKTCRLLCFMRMY